MNNETTKKVTDVSLPDKGFIYKNASATRSYEYDHNGNLKSDLNKGITNIEYNFLNLPQVITFTNDSIGRPRRLEFIYDASGAKLRKTRFLNNIAEETIHYVNGVEYKNNVLERVAHTEGGVIRVVDPVTSAVSYQQEYILRDHLGNTRVTFSDTNNDSLVTSADIKQINSYYPFGLNMEGNWNGAKGDNKTQYNVKEWNDDFGLGWNDYGARWYDPSVGRWGAIDPSTEKYARWSPYNYVSNNPIKMIDPDGKDNILYVIFITTGQKNDINQKEILKTLNYILQEVNGINAKAVGIEFNGQYPFDLSKLDATDKVAYVGARAAINGLQIPQEKNGGFFEIETGSGYVKGDSDSGKGEGRVSVTNTDAFFPYLGETNYNNRDDDNKYTKLNGEGFGISSNIARNIAHEMGHNILGISHPDQGFGGGHYYLLPDGRKSNLMTSGEKAVRQPMAQDPGLLRALPIDIPKLQQAFPDTNTPTDNWSKTQGLKTIKE